MTGKDRSYLIIPGFDRILESQSEIASIPDLVGSWKERIAYRKIYRQMLHLYGLNESSYEGTHLDVLLAKESILRAGFSSAIFVSHPYHMRRVKMIASKVFEDCKIDLFFIPTRHEGVNRSLWWLDNKERNLVVTEYLKIAWFLLYTTIPGLSSG